MTGQPIAVFDLGLVLVTPIGLFEGLAALLGVTPAQVAEVYSIHRRPYDTGLPDKDYWSRTLAELGPLPAPDGDGASSERPAGLRRSAHEPSAAPPRRDLDALLPALVAADVAGWSTPQPEAVALLNDVKRCGVTTVVLSNAPLALAEAAPHLPWADPVDAWFFSALLGLTKPDPAIYAHVERALGVTPDQLWFVDDRPENVQAARDRGWSAHRWRDPEQARQWFVAGGLLLG